MKTIPDTETMLIKMAQRGDVDAFNMLVLEYQDMLYRIAWRILQDEFAADDATQNAMIQAFKNLRSFRGGSFKSWLARVTVNASYDEMRRWKRQPAISLEQVNSDGDEIESPLWMRDPVPGPQEAAESSEMSDAIQHCLRRLVPDYRTVVILVDIEGMSYEEAARTARIPVGTVKSRLARARMQIRRALRSFEGLLPHAYQVEMPAFAHA
jgi:RNA polymerase sigma-70 factor (ECF subfamily)